MQKNEGGQGNSAVNLPKKTKNSKLQQFFILVLIVLLAIIGFFVGILVFEDVIFSEPGNLDNDSDLALLGSASECTVPTYTTTGCEAIPLSPDYLGFGAVGLLEDNDRITFTSGPHEGNTYTVDFCKGKLCWPGANDCCWMADFDACTAVPDETYNHDFVIVNTQGTCETGLVCNQGMCDAPLPSMGLVAQIWRSAKRFFSRIF
ncbi:hypothetical protein GOV14_06160 [Candidatus Pacearchaeota archaeon]|nr:hypothetical protein [Candidatus Pacearchaeota archaeon]